MQLPMFTILLILMFEVIEFGQSAKFIRPHKFYAPHPRRPPRWYRTGSQHHKSEKISPESYEPYYRYAPHYENWMSAPSDNKPYIVVIQLPNEKNELHSYQRHRKGEFVGGCAKMDDYVDDDDNNELKTYQLDNKRIHTIKINKRQTELA